jgi:DNA-binding transcriptional LysR family regulator
MLAGVFNVVQSSTATQFRELRERTVDLTLARLRTPLRENDLTTETLFDDRVFIVAGAQNPWSRRRKIEFSKLAHEPWIALPPDNDASSFLADAFKARGLALPNPAVVTFSQHVRFHLLAKGRYHGPSRFRAAVQRRALLAQIFTGRYSISGAAYCDRHTQRSAVESDRKTLHRLCPRGLEAVDERNDVRGHWNIRSIA